MNDKPALEGLAGVLPWAVFFWLLVAAIPAHAAAPVPVNDTIVVTERYRVSDSEYRVIVDVIANDRDADGDPLLIDPDSITQPITLSDDSPRGSILKLDDETLIYTATDYSADERFEAVSFEYRLFGSAAQAKVMLQEPDGNSEPIEDLLARDDGAITAPGTPVVIPVLENDVAADVIRSVGAPANGSVEIISDDTEIRYTPGAGFESGEDQFPYTAGQTTDADATSTATVTVTVDDEPPSDLTVVLKDDFGDIPEGEDLRGEVPQIDLTPGGTAWDGLGTIGLIKRSLSIDGIVEAVITNKDDVSFASSRLFPSLDFNPDDFDGDCTPTSCDIFVGDDYEIEASVGITDVVWAGVALRHDDNDGTGPFFDCGATGDPPDLDLWGTLEASGRFRLRTGCAGAEGTVLADIQATNSTNPFDVFLDKLNDVRIRVEEGCSDFFDNACVSAWINGKRVIDRVKYENFQSGSISPSSTIRLATTLINVGTETPEPETVIFDDFFVRVGVVKEPRIRVTYKPSGSSSEVEVQSGDSIVLDPIWETQSATLEVLVRNDGNADLSVSGVSLAVGDAWSIESATSTVSPGSVGVFNLRLSGANPGTFSDTITFDTNDDRFPEFQLELEGEVMPVGSDPVASADSFVLPIQLENRVTVLIDKAPCSTESLILLCNDKGTEIQFSSDPFPSPSHGELSIQNPAGGFYTPDPGYRGNDSFVYEIVDAIGRTDSAIATITMDGPPLASFSASCDEAVCAFDAASSSDLEDGSVLQSYAWDFGDGTLGSGRDPVHSYGASGTYAVTLTVTDSLGQTDSVTSNVLVDRSPVASFTFSCLDRDCSFDASASSDDNGIVRYDWSFGDGASGTGATASHTYPTSGTFQVELRVTDTIGQTAVATQSVNVDVRPTASFTVNCTSLTCDLDASASTDDFGIASYQWAFGDGSAPGSGAVTTHQFPEEGSYTVVLTVTDTIGQIGSTSAPVTVHDEESFLLLLILDEDD